MPTVTVSARHFVMPALCVCCLGPPGGGAIRASARRTRGKRVVRAEEHTLAFPACARCAAHHDAEPDGWSYVAGVILTLGVLAPLLIPLYLARRRRAQSLRLPTCPREGSAVTLEGWFATEHRFWFAQPAAADAFLRANLAAGKTAWADARAAGGGSVDVSTGLLVALAVIVGACLLAGILGDRHNASPAIETRPIPTGPPPTPEELRANAPAVDAATRARDVGTSHPHRPARHQRP